MKIIQICSTILVTLAFVSGEEIKSNLRSLSEEERELQDVKEVLAGEECIDFAADIFKQMKKVIMKNSEKSVTQYYCNPIGRKLIRQTSKKLLKSANEDDGNKHPCFAATQKLILSKKEDVKKGHKSRDTCKAQITKEIRGFKNVVEEARRELAEQGERDMQVLTGAALAGVITAGITTAGAVATAAIGVASTAVKSGGAIGMALAKKKKRRVRKLSKLESALDYETIEDTFELCKDQKYSLLMYVESDGGHDLGHINIVAKPLDSNNEDCRDALTFDDYDAGERLISFVDDVGFAGGWHADALPLGIFVLGDVKAAADLASVVKPNEYDIMTNNCATFVIEVLGHLKIPITTEVKHYAVNSLVESPGLVEAIGGSDSAEPSAKKEMMWNFVSKYAEDHKLL